MTGSIRTILGDIDPQAAGLVDSHDHLFLSTPALADEALDDAESAEEELRAFSTEGGSTLVQWTPRGLGRNLAGLRRLSRTSGIHIVAATGRHRAAYYEPSAHVVAMRGDELARAFIDDVRGERCGLVKVGISEPTITVDEADALRAAAATHHATGVPIAIHLEGGSAAELVVEFLARENVPMRSVVLGHLGRNPDRGAIIDAARSGAWLCLDAPSPRHPMDDDQLAGLVDELIAHDHESQLLLGADTTTASAGYVRSGRGAAGLIRRTAAHLGERLGPQVVDRMLRVNPAAAWQQRETAAGNQVRRP